MKKSRKLISLLMALAMIFALAIPAFAATTTATAGGEGTITIKNAVSGETYSVYQMMEVTYNETTGSYSYKVLSDWVGFFGSTGAAATYFTLDSNNYITATTLTTGSSQAADVAKDALQYAKDNSIEAAATVLADENGATIKGLALGYYLVDTTLGTLCSIDTAVTTIEIEEKNSATPTEDKTVSNSEGGDYSGSNSASIGDTVYYKVVLTNLANKSNVSVVDTLSKGLTLVTNNGTAEVTVTVTTTENETETVNDVYSVNYSVDYSENTDGTTTLTIAFTEEYLATLSSDAVLTVAYSAVINNDAIIGTDGNTNSAILNYGTDHTVEDTTTTYVYDFDLKKVDDEENLLSGAKFTLKNSDDIVVELVEIDATETEYSNCYRVPTASEIEDDSGEVTTTIEAGYVNISGLAAGTYTLTETEAPTGYNLLKDPVEITINANGTVTYGTTTGAGVSIVNEAGSELPSTGGMGTTLFYIFGGAMVLCAVVLLVTRRRMDNEQ